MNLPRFAVFCTALLSIAVYGLALWSEAARNAAGLGFNERFGIARLAEGFPKVTAQEWHQLRFDHWEHVAVVGMIAALIAAIVGIRSVPRWLPPAYLAVLLIMGGWVGMVMVVYLPLFVFSLLTDPVPMDGEFFEDSVARYMAAGVWLSCLLVWSVKAFINRPPKVKAEPRVHHHA